VRAAVKVAFDELVLGDLMRFTVRKENNKREEGEERKRREKEKS
jgi:hypothetical protein